MRADVAAVLAFDVDATLRAAREAEAKRIPEDRERAELALECARFEAAEFLIDGGSPEEARFAAAWLLRRAA
jgi:hypothetical protein